VSVAAPTLKLFETREEEEKTRGKIASKLLGSVQDSGKEIRTLKSF